MDEATKIVNKLLSKKESEFLRDPVDWQALGLHDYPAIIKTPMDLKTVKKKLEMESYRDPTRVAADIRLIFLNAMTYNAPGSRIYSQAKNLSEFFESNCKGLFKNVEDVDKPANAEEMGAWVDKCHRSWYCLRIPELYYTLS
jgi:bromodomain-containing protein 3